MVKALVKSGITICATIHSPTPYCFNLFDTLMILLRGHVVYFGENGVLGCRASGALQEGFRTLVWVMGDERVHVSSPLRGSQRRMTWFRGDEHVYVSSSSKRVKRHWTHLTCNRSSPLNL